MDLSFLLNAKSITWAIILLGVFIFLIWVIYDLLVSSLKAHKEIKSEESIPIRRGEENE